MNKDIANSLAWGGGIVALALAASFARSQGLIDQEATTRLIIGATGLMIASFGNQMPKRFSPDDTARKVQRLGGWSLAITGLIYAGLWVFAPVPAALWLGCSAVAAGMTVTIAYCLWLRRRARPA